MNEMAKIKLKQFLMDNYYSDEELRESFNISAKITMKWLEEARQFMNKAVSREDKKLKEQLILEGW